MDFYFSNLLGGESLLVHNGFIIYFSIGSGIEDVREVERHSFFAHIPFYLYEEKKVGFCFF